VDIVPTICHILGTPSPPTAVGRPLTEFEDPLPLEAEDRVRLAELTLSSLSGKCDLSAAEEALTSARERLESADYSGAIELADQAIQLAKLSSDAKRVIELASQAVDQARQEGRTEGLSEAESKLSEATAAYSAGDYLKAKQLAEEAESAAKEATKPSIITAKRTILVVGIVIVVVAGSAVYVLTRRRRTC